MAFAGLVKCSTGVDVSSVVFSRSTGGWMVREPARPWPDSWYRFPIGERSWERVIGKCFDHRVDWFHNPGYHISSMCLVGVVHQRLWWQDRAWGAVA